MTRPQARQHFEQAMVLDPRNVVRTRTLLQEAQRAGARDAAERWSRHLVDLTHSASDREYLANLLYARQRYNEAAEEYLKVATATQDRRLRHSAYLAMGNALAAAKRPDGAVRACGRGPPEARSPHARGAAQRPAGQRPARGNRSARWASCCGSAPATNAASSSRSCSRRTAGLLKRHAN